MPDKEKDLRYVIKPHPKTYTGIKNILMMKMQSILGQDNNALFAAVYGVNETEPAGYPVCYVIERAGKGQILDTHRNEREWQFDIVIHQVISNKTPQQAYEALLDAADRVITKIDQDPMLQDEHGQEQCKWVRVVPMEFEYATQDAAVHRALLTVAVVDIVNRYAP